jgi:hypothetical protein
MQGIDIGIGIDGDGLHAIVGAGSRDAHGDLATVGNQNFGNHGCHLRKRKTGMRDRRRLLRRPGNLVKQLLRSCFRHGWQSELFHQLLLTRLQV